MSTEKNTHSLPCNEYAEQAVLGGLMLDPESVAKVSAKLQPAHFYRGRHRIVYEAILALASRGAVVDPLTVHGELERIGKLEDAGGDAYVLDLMTATPTLRFTEHYAGIIRQAAIARQVIAACQTIAAKAYENPPDPVALLAESVGLLDDIAKGERSGRLLTPADRASIAFDRFARRQSGEREGIPYGLLALDKWTQGAEPGQLVILGGRASMGKTSLLQHIASHMAAVGKRVLFASAEMPDAQLTDREIAAETGVSVHQLQAGQFGEATWGQVEQALHHISQHGWYTLELSDMTTAHLRAGALEMRARYGLDVVAVDYLQILADRTGRSEVERVTGISRELKALARSLNVPVIAAAQLNRAPDSRDDKRPMLSDLRESGAIEQDADLVAFIFRQGYYSKDPNDNTAELIIAKQRNGPAGISSPLLFDRRVTRFRDAELHHAR